LSGARRLLGATALAAVLAVVPSAACTGRAATAPTLSQLAGQTILARMRGTTPSAAFLRRVRLGQVGGVVLYSDNYGAAGPKLLVARLQQAAEAGGQPPLLVAIDQEGGIVKRLAGAPTLAPAQMRTAAIARAQGLATAHTLLRNGVDVDLAPVCDVGRGGFITPRAFGPTPATVAVRCPAFARGLAQGGVAATAKHFPGLGYAATTTDTGAITVTASRARLQADLLPFKAAIAAHVPLVMVSTAVYPALDPAAPAALSKPVVHGLLRGSVGFDGVVITDALDTPAVAHYAPTGQAAVRALAAGADEVIAAGDTPADADAVSTAAYDAVLDAARSGALPRARLQASYRRILALKQSLAH
jgi:beta-N-acetylhexosaminidase